MRKPSLYKSFGNAFRGILFLLKNERNFQIEVLGLLINLFLIVYLKLERLEIALILMASFFVLVTEALNTCVEKICDFVHPEYNKYIGIIKDIAAGAVVIAVLAAVLTGIYVYLPYIIDFVSS
ncbi:MAG: diacylglycerol kinase family protein [Flavobacteriaceae bacterium]|jgi:diacylglycerol kinase|uniref:diacylglycerol kinase n=1 Tax=Elizabethkingia ursingii TaxID=1756150 RepID=UPI000750C435|nr:diacylglycerol kinase family protein [Elizabethkingia ursingii]KUY31612.1 diacylglycerol kinase [Elizabethkingia ursingii]MDR2231426.1 diacylglycerol kinase family protein [Flavobacteriaceae bacterium]